MSDTQASELITRINQDMRQAIKDRDLIKLNELRSLLARISNAEAVPQSSNIRYDGPIAGAKNGVGSTEVNRKHLSLKDIQTVVSDEINEIEAVLNSLDANDAYIAELREKIAVIEIYK